jgi:uncharacterized protein (TIGR02145 family)
MVEYHIIILVILVLGAVKIDQIMCERYDVSIESYIEKLINKRVYHSAWMQMLQFLFYSGLSLILVFYLQFYHTLLSLIIWYILLFLLPVLSSFSLTSAVYRTILNLIAYTFLILTVFMLMFDAPNKITITKTFFSSYIDGFESTDNGDVSTIFKNASESQIFFWEWLFSPIYLITLYGSLLGSGALFIFLRRKGIKRNSGIRIGSQIWMTSNLDVENFKNGDIIPQAISSDEWIKAYKNQQPAWCYYNNDTVNGKTYGKLYNWYAVNDPRGLAPHGWHIPSDEEWSDLMNYLYWKGGGDKLKSTRGWLNKGNGNNSSGFSGLPGGFRHTFGSFSSLGTEGFWWSSSKYNEGKSWRRRLRGHSDYTLVYWGSSAFNGRYTADNGDGLSVRCLRD